MKIIIKTAGNYGKELKCLMEKRMPDVEIIGFTDNNCNKWNTICEGVMIYSPFKCIELMKNNEVDKVVIPMRRGYSYVNDMYFELKGLGIAEEDILISSVNIYDTNSELNNDNAFVKICDFNYINMGYTASFKCNLNCKRCGVFSPLYKNDTIDTIEDFKKYVLRFKELIPYFTEFAFFGGEPLLQNDIGECIKFFRSVYPVSPISITTNGILIKSLSDELLEVLRDNQVTINMSVYPVMVNKIDDVYDFVRSKGININIMGYRMGFLPVLCDEHPFPYNTVEHVCICPTFYRGKLASCSRFVSVSKYNETFGTDYEYEDGLIDIFDENLKPGDIMPRLLKPYKLCNSCNVYKIKSNSAVITTSGSLSETAKWDHYKAGEQPKAEDWFAK